MARKQSDRTLQILNTELVALLEYAKDQQIDVDAEQLMAVLHPLIYNEISAKYEKNADIVNVRTTKTQSKSEQDAERQHKAAMQTEAGKRMALAARHNLDSPAVNEQVKIMLDGYMHGNADSIEQLCKNGGSLLSLFTKAKQDTSEEVVNTLGITEHIKDKHAYFVPTAVVQNYMRRKNISRFTQAMNELQRNKSILCNFMLDQQNPNGDWYIKGGAVGLKILLGKPAMPGKPQEVGILDVCGIEPKTRDLVIANKGRGSTNYDIVLDRDNGLKFQNELTDSTSKLRSKYITLTDVSQTSTTSTDSNQGSSDGEDNQMEKKQQGNLVHGQDLLVSGRTDDSSSILETMQLSINRVYNAVNQYNEANARFNGSMPELKDLPQVQYNENDPYDTILKEIDAISECASSFCKSLGVELPLVHGKSGAYSVDVAIFNYKPRNQVMARIDRNIKYSYAPAIKRQLKTMTDAFHACLWYIDKNIQKVLPMMKFGDDIDGSVSDEKETAIDAQRKTREALMSQRYTTIDNKAFTLSDLLNKVPDNILGDFDDGEHIIQYNPEFVEEYKKSNEIEVRLSRNATVSDDEIKQNCAKLAEMLLSHVNDAIRLDRLSSMQDDLSGEAIDVFDELYPDLEHRNDAFYPILPDMWKSVERELFGNQKELYDRFEMKLGKTSSAESSRVEPEVVDNEPVKKPEIKAPVAPANRADISQTSGGRKLSLDDFDEDSELADMTISRV